MREPAHKHTQTNVVFGKVDGNFSTYKNKKLVKFRKIQIRHYHASEHLGSSQSVCSEQEANTL
jgi:hypothetical protein